MKRKVFFLLNWGILLKFTDRYDLLCFFLEVPLMGTMIAWEALY